MYLGLRQEHPDLTIVVTRPDSAAEAVIDADDDVFSLQGLEADTDDDGAREELPDPPGPDEPFVIVYTSGTTSRPKGCVHTFNPTVRRPCADRAVRLHRGRCAVRSLPRRPHHRAGHQRAGAHAGRGVDTHDGRVGSRPRHRRDSALRLHGSGDSPDIPTRAVVRIRPDRHDLSSLRLWTCAGAPIPAAVVERASAKLPNMRVLSLYGRSENLVTTTCSVDDDISRALTSDGKPMPGAEVKIVDEGDEVPRGAEGDIAYRGPAHMIEYLGNPEETAALFTDDGFSESGDLGKMTDDGYVRVTGRTKDIVIRGGMNISVREIEDHLAHHPALQAFSVVGMPDERLGERVCCYVVAKPGHTPPTVDDLREFLLEKGMPIQKTPERVVAVDALPMTATGKVLKHELRKDIEGASRRKRVIPRKFRVPADGIERQSRRSGIPRQGT